MNIDPVELFRARVAKHAALADPARLRIVDLLTLGDLSPTELQAELGMPSNLLSHHLRTLEDAGLAIRPAPRQIGAAATSGSPPGALEGLVPGREHGARRVLFVCTRNSARSQLAVALWNQVSEIPSTSAGTHPADRIASGAIDVARRHGVALADLPPRRLDEVADDEDFIVTVAITPTRKSPTSAGSTGPSRIRSGPNTEDAFESAFNDIARRISDLAPRLHAA